MYKKMIPGLFVLLIGISPVQADGDVELVEYMRSLQYFAHKVSLAVDKHNRQLAGFYAHELEEYIEKLEKVKSYDDYPIAELSEKILKPAFEEFEKAVKSDKADMAIHLDRMIQACNKCHTVTRHGFIKIERRKDNPFMQSFEP